MIGPVANSPNAGLRRGYKNIVQVVGAFRIATLELHSCQAAGRLDSECLGNIARICIEIVIKLHAVKEGTKPVVSVPRVIIHGLIEKAHVVESPRCSGKGLADRVKIGPSGTKECAESTVGRRRQGGHAKVTSGRR